MQAQAGGGGENDAAASARHTRTKRKYLYRAIGTMASKTSKLKPAQSSLPIHIYR